MEGLSRKEVEIVSWLEFYQKYFFSASDIDRFATGRTQRYNIIKNLVRKKRIVKLSKDKYYLVPIKAMSGSWAEYPFIIADEACGGAGYFIGGWAAANYWRMSDQIPMQFDIYTTKRQGKTTLLNTRFVFHRTTRKNLQKAVTQTLNEHPFRILGKEHTKKWMKSKR